MNSDSSPFLPPVREQAKSELATLVKTVIDHERRKARAAVETTCQTVEMEMEHFNDLVARSQLIAEEDWDELLKEPPADSLSRWVNRLVDSELLSTWQAHKLLAGKYKGFVVGNYQVRDVLGQGAAGAVYLGHHKTMRRPVALKVLAEKVTRDDDAMEITFQRMGMLSDLDHDHVVHYFDVGQANRAVYLVMEVIEGRSLQQLIRRYRRLPQPLVREIGWQLLDALDYVHRETGGIPRSAIDNIVADTLGQIHVLTLDLTATLSLDLSYDQTSLVDAVRTFGELLKLLDPDWAMLSADEILSLASAAEPFSDLRRWVEG